MSEPPSCPGATPPRLGEGTHYDADGSGRCSFPAGDRMVAAISGPDYDGAASCGACVEVSGPNGDTVVRIVDVCPRCKAGDLDLSVEAFAEIAPVRAGRIPISWRVVPCEVTGPVAYHFKDGSSAHWMAIQVRDHRYPIAGLEARDPGGEWRSFARAAYNYFIAPDGLGPGPHTLRVSDTRGHAIIDDYIAAGADVLRTGKAQLALCRD